MAVIEICLGTKEESSKAENDAIRKNKSWFSVIWAHKVILCQLTPWLHPEQTSGFGHIITAPSGLPARIYLFWEKKKRQAVVNFSWLGGQPWWIPRLSITVQFSWARTAAHSCQRDPANSEFLRDAHGVSILDVFKYIFLVKQTGWWRKEFFFHFISKLMNFKAWIQHPEQNHFKQNK